MNQRPSSLPPEVLAALSSGNKIEAIALLRKATGLSLAAAKAAVENGAFEPVPQVRGELSSALPPQVAAELARGNKIKAIKLLRQATGLGLKDARDAVDAAERMQSPAHGDAVPGVEPNWSIVSLGLWMVGIAIALVAFWYFRLR